MKTQRYPARKAIAYVCLGSIIVCTPACQLAASDYSTQAYIGGADSGVQVNQVAAVDVTAADGGPLEVTTWQGQPGRVLGHAVSTPCALSLFLHAQGGINNSLSGRCLLWETFVAHDTNRHAQPLEADLVVALGGSETGLPGAAGGYPRANGGLGLIVDIPWRNGISTNLSFFGETNLNASGVLTRRFGMVEGVPLTIVAELDLSVGTTGGLDADSGITADFDARLFIRPVDSTVTITSASGDAYVLPASVPPKVTVRSEPQRLTLSWPAEHRGWRLVMRTNTFGGVMNTNGCSDCLGGRWFNVFGAARTNDIVLPVRTNLSSVFYQLVWP